MQTLIWRIVCNTVFGGGYGYSFVGKQWVKSNRKHKSDNKENNLLKTVRWPRWHRMTKFKSVLTVHTELRLTRSSRNENKDLMKRREVQQPELVTRRQSCLNLAVLSSCLPIAALWKDTEDLRVFGLDVCTVLHLPHSTPSGFKGTRSCHVECGWLWSCLQLKTSDLCLKTKQNYTGSWADTVNSCCHFTSLEKMYKRNSSNTPMWHFSVQYYSCCNTT